MPSPSGYRMPALNRDRSKEPIASSSTAPATASCSLSLRNALPAINSSRSSNCALAARITALCSSNDATFQVGVPGSRIGDHGFPFRLSAAASKLQISF